MERKPIPLRQIYVYHDENEGKPVVSLERPGSQELTRIARATKTQLSLLFETPASAFLSRAFAFFDTHELVGKQNLPDDVQPERLISRILAEAYADGWEYVVTGQGDELTNLQRDHLETLVSPMHPELTRYRNAALRTFAQHRQISTETLRAFALSLFLEGCKAARRVQEELAPILEDLALEYASRRSEQGLQELMSSLGYSEKEIDKHKLLIRKRRDRLGLPEEEL